MRRLAGTVEELEESASRATAVSGLNLSAGNVRVIGVGGMSLNVLNYLGEDWIDGVELLAVDTDPDHLAVVKGAKRVRITSPTLGRVGGGGSPDRARRAAIDHTGDIMGLVEGADLAVIIAGMGGATGSGIAPVVAGICREMGILTLAIASTPFCFEGTARAAQAQEGLTSLAGSADTVFHIPIREAFRSVPGQTPFVKALERYYGLVAQAVKGVLCPLLQAESNPVSANFSDLVRLFRCGATGQIAVGSATGPNRALEALRAALGQDGSLIGGRALGDASGIWTRLEAGYDIGLHDVDDVTRALEEMAHPDATVVHNVSIDRRLAGTIRVTVLASGYPYSRPRFLGLPNGSGMSRMGRPDGERLPDRGGARSRPGVRPQGREPFTNAWRRPAREATGLVVGPWPPRPREAPARAQRAEQPEQAEQRARGLIDQFLPEQARRYAEQSFIEVKSALHKDRVYRIYQPYGTTIFSNGEQIGRACLMLSGGAFPPTDRVLAEYFLIRGDEECYLATANITWTRPRFGPARERPRNITRTRPAFTPAQERPWRHHEADEADPGRLQVFGGVLVTLLLVAIIWGLVHLLR